MTVASETRSPLSLKSLLPLASASVAVGLAMALAMPFMALFLTTEVGASPVALGTFLLISPLAGLVASTVLGRVSDSRAVRRNLLVVGGAAGAGGSALFAVLRNYWILLAVSVTLLAVASSLLSQVFAYARQATERSSSTRAPLVISGFRTLLSLAWVGGPPLAALLMAKTGYVGLYLASAGFYGLVAVVTMRLPELGSATTGQADSDRGMLRPQVVLAVAAFVLLQGSVTLSVNAVPLLVTDVLHGTAGDAGLILGLCAALEIPLILGFGMLAVRIEQHRIVCFGAVVALAYHVVMFTTSSTAQVAVAQVLNAIVISAIMGVGISYFQALAPDRPGLTTTLYTNTITVGVMVSGPLLGLAQEIGYRTAYLMCLAMSALGLILLVTAGMTARRESVR
ncbi:SET family sugar efflux transporter-like MFS transporter [Kibdelosporangium banguiense]|uniref:SET family sugar efflux transporter-like MFS transporter n=1 Tax=Kibdelosporangium banguiense TaxID=1365924 RepID=A0ABS4TTK8_9PSEU|nr:sugar efflux transporter [Kibdelosporangium banguiense]MBP2327735.1 SET family sugar efflux transporter-like MFS transporter [Kibdelosporangium banguiense]